MMYQFRVHIHPLVKPAAAKVIASSGRELNTLALNDNPPSFHVTFDRASEILTTLPRMFIEPDGSFVWTGEADAGKWQVDGVLYDAGPRLAYVEMSGRCPADEFDQFLAALGWPAAPVMFQLVEQGVFIAECEFRQLAGS